MYNLTIDGEHEYFANGILVSNCDAARYLHKDMTHYLHKPTDAAPVDDLERLRREGERLERQVDDSEARRRRAQEQEEADLEARWGPGSGEGQGYYE